MGRLITTAALLAALLASPVLSGCSGDGGASTPTPSPTPTSTSPTASPTPQPPAMPEAARAHTEAGAIAFVEHYLALINYATASLDVAPVVAASLPGCKGCAAGAEGISRIKRENGTIIGGKTTATDMKAQLSQGETRTFATITYKGTSAPETHDLPGTDDVNRAGGNYAGTIILVSATDGWRVAEFEVRQ